MYDVTFIDGTRNAKMNMQKHRLTGWLQKPRSGGIFLPGNNPKHAAKITVSKVSKKKKKAEI